MLKTAIPLFFVALALGTTYYTQHIEPTSHKKPAKIQVVSSNITHHRLATVTPSPTPSPTPTPTPAPRTPAPTPKPVAAAAPITASSNPQPVVVPAPSSSVSNLVPTSTPTPTPTPTPGPGPSPSPTPTPAVTSGYSSTNWSGYFASGAKFTAISGSWTVPTATGNGVSTSADASWIGIGGVTAGDLIQVGTDNTVSASGHLVSEAFYELLPDASVTVPGITVTAGDTMTASISEISAGQWSISITDTNNSQSFTIHVAYTSSYSSAEWIEEDPSYSNGTQVPFDHFGSVPFLSGSTKSGGSNVSISGANSQPITMVNSSHQPIATPTILTNGGTSFSVAQN